MLLRDGSMCMLTSAFGVINGNRGLTMGCPLCPLRTDIVGQAGNVRLVLILLQKSQKAQRLISRQRTKQAKIANQ